MTYTPVELRHVHVGRRLLGYNRRAVEKILDDVADSFETVWRDRGELSDKVELLEDQLQDLKAREQLLIQTLASAEQVASEVREQAKREAEVILAEAHQEARSVWLSAQAERERLFAETKRIGVYLRAALDIVVEGGAAEPTPEVQEPLPLWHQGETGEESAAGSEAFTAADLDAALDPDSAPEHESHLRFLPKVVGWEPRELDWED